MKKMNKAFAGLLMTVGLFSASLAQTLPQINAERDAEWEKIQMRDFESPDPYAIPNRPVLKYEDWTTPKIETMWAEMNAMPAMRAQRDGAKGANIGTDNLEKMAEINNAAWGRLTSMEDGTSLFFMQQDSLLYRLGELGQPYYQGTRITLLNENFTAEKSFYLPAYDTVMSISMMSMVSTSFFNTDAKREFVIQVHAFERLSQGPAYARDTVYVVNEDGEVLQRYGTAASAIMNKVGNQNHLVVYAPNYSISDSVIVNVYDAKTQDKCLFHYAKERKLTNYTSSAVFGFQEVEGEPYYQAIFYEKPYTNGDPRDPQVTADNQFILQLIDAKTFNLATEFKLDIFGQDKHEWSMGAVRFFNDIAITRTYFDKDEDLELIYTVDRHLDECDCYTSDIYVVDEHGNIEQEIFTGAGGVRKLQSLPGQPDEYAVFDGTEEAVTGIVMMQMPSMETFRFSPLYNGEALSLTFERMADPTYGRKYFFHLRSGEYYQDTASLCFTYYTPDGELIKKVRAKIGDLTVKANAIITSETLNPYLFNDNEDMEIIIMGMEEPQKDVYESYIAIVSEETGSVLYKFYDDAAYGAISSGGLISNKKSDKATAFYILYSQPGYYGGSSTVFYSLPFASGKMKGEGTEANPYIITTPAELERVNEDLEAWYELGNDIEMGGWLGINNKGFAPIGGETGFKGHLDGKGHAIRGLFINSNAAYVGLFGFLSGAEVKNLDLEVNVTGGKANSMIGGLAGFMTAKAVVENVHVSGWVMASAAAAAMGGLAGNAMQEGTAVRQSSFTGTVDGNGTNVGGLFGQFTQNAVMEACYAEGVVRTSNTAGGLIGDAKQSASVRNVYAAVEVTGGRNAGGLAGTLGIPADRTYAAGSVTGTRNVGGISSSMGSGVNIGRLTRSVGLNASVAATTASNSVYRITFWNSGYENMADTNFALSTMKIRKAEEESVIAADDAEATQKGKHGESKTLAEMNEAFYKETLQWGFGTTLATPWVMNGDRPHLWFEYAVRGVTLNMQKAKVYIGHDITLTAAVVPAVAENKAVTWISDDPSVASVDENGKVTGKKRGTTVITAITDEGDFEASCEITVLQGVDKLDIVQESVVVGINEVVTFDVTIEPATADNPSILWKSANSSIAIVGGGQVRGMTLGSTWAFAMSEDGLAIDSCLIEVVVPITRIILDKSEVALKVGETEQLTATVRPSDASLEGVVWSSSDENVATVSDNGLVTATGEGSALITASSSSNPKVKAVCEVKVGSVGVEDLEIANSSIYVRDGWLYVESASELRWLRVVDMSGRILLQETLAGQNASVSLQQMVSGVYVLRIGFASGKTGDWKFYK